jgi:hypothetical protein
MAETPTTAATATAPANPDLGARPVRLVTFDLYDTRIEPRPTNSAK